MPNSQLFACDFHRHLSQLVDRNHFIRADVNRSREIGFHQPPDALNALVDIQERAGLLSIAPDFDLAAVRGLGYLATYRGGCLLASPIPSSFGSTITRSSTAPDAASA